MKQREEVIIPMQTVSMPPEMKILTGVRESIKKFMDVAKQDNFRGIDKAFKRAVFKLKAEKIEDILQDIDPEQTSHNTTEKKIKEMSLIIFSKLDLLAMLEAKIKDGRDVAFNVIWEVWAEKRKLEPKYNLGNLTTAFQIYLDTIQRKNQDGKGMKDIWKEEFPNEMDADDEDDDLDVEEMAKIFMKTSLAG